MSPIHTPGWHLLDSAFPDANRGLVPPPRNLSAAGASLRIANLDRADPPGYRPGDYPRGACNGNVFALTGAGAMPVIPVRCEFSGFDPARTPVEWRLVCRHILCRHTNAGAFRYKGATGIFEREWRGSSPAAAFQLFAPGCPCSYNSPGNLMGGNALLMAAVRLPGATLLDYVHVRICGANPAPAGVLDYLDGRLGGYDPNIALMVRAAFAHESGFRQFAPDAQSAVAMNFTRAFHQDAAQPDCRVRFDFPDDPPAFPLASFDFGVGISQWTEVGGQRVTADIAWDWRENIRIGANHLLRALARSLKPGITWRNAARAAWAMYNGSGAAAAAYAALLAASPDGLAISGAPVPKDRREVALLAAPTAPAAPEPWTFA